MSKQVCYDAMRIARGGGVVARDMMPHGVRSPIRTVYRTIGSDPSNEELVIITTCGPATTFDPKITGVDGVWFFDDGTILAASSGSEISKTFAAEGLHRAVYRPALGGLAAITAIDSRIDAITSVSFSRLMGLVRVDLWSNDSSLVIDLKKYSNGKLTRFAIDSQPATIGAISDIANNPLTHLGMASCVKVTGSLSELPATLTICYLQGCVLITAASVAHLTDIRDIRIYSMGWLTADVDTVINSIWAARANYTYATPALQIGGTNQPPTGNVTAPIEGADWHQDGTTWIPLTTGAKAYDLAKDVNSEGFKKWTITYTGGSIAP